MHSLPMRTVLGIKHVLQPPLIYLLMHFIIIHMFDLFLKLLNYNNLTNYSDILCYHENISFVLSIL